MFEDSTFESTGTIHTRSQGWMFATFVFNASIVLAMIFIPLIYPEALSRIMSPVLMVAPPQPQEPRPLTHTERTPAPQQQMHSGILDAFSKIPKQPYIPTAPEAPINNSIIALGAGDSDAVGAVSPISGSSRPVVRMAQQQSHHVSSGVMVGYLIYRAVPHYPSIAIAIHLGGTVVLQATISKTGSIENLHVVSGPPLLHQAAIDAVQQWRYRPYLLNNQPVEVETTINVEFTLQ